MAIIDVDGEIVDVNPNFFKFLDINQGDNIKQAFDEQSLIEFEEILKQMVPAESISCDFVLKVNTQHLCIVKTHLYFEEQKNIIILLFDLPMKVKKNEAKDWISELDRAECLLLVSNRAGYIQEMNNLSSKFFNLSKEHFIGEKIEVLLSLFSEDSDDLRVTRNEIITSEQMEVIHQYIHPTKNIRYYKIEKIKDTTSDLFLLKITDYTQKVVLQQELSQKESLLEVGQLAASVAHEIRNPVTTLKGFTQLLKVTADKNVMKYLNVFEDEIERIENILSEMLTLSKPTKINRKPLSLKELLSNIICVIEPKAIMENIKIIQEDEFQGRPFIHGDEGRLKQVFLNLFKNGLESMQPGGKLTIYLQHCGTNQVNIIIKDTGKGIEEQNLKQIFMPYFTTRADGTGLGMPFVLQVVENHGGTISVSSEVGVGTSFILTFPTIEPNGVIYRVLENEEVGK